jgi:hypothetical protein
VPITTPTDAYCNVSDIQSLLPARRYDGNSKPTFDGAEAIIKDVAKEINGVLRALGYSPPLTGTHDAEDLRTMNKYGAAALIESATLIGVQGQSALAVAYMERYTAMLAKLSAGEWKFEDAGAPPSSSPDANDDLDAAGERSDPIFRMSESQRKTQF